jgi:hypothetical protein
MVKQNIKQYNMVTPLLKKIMKGPKCWKGYVAKGKKKSPSGKKNPDGSPKMVNNCVKKGSKK